VGIILVTGAAGFIGSHFVELLLENRIENIIIVDKLTYAGKYDNMKTFIDSDRVNFVLGDICDRELIDSIFSKNSIEQIINFAAESHVDNSIINSETFTRTNVLGTNNLLQIAKKYWWVNNEWITGVKFVQISTDEVYGSIELGSFEEDSKLIPSSPYSASKASADLLCLSYFITFNFPVIITRSSNNYGPRQDKEKFIPKVVVNILNNHFIPLYGDGKNIRDWIFVKDNCRMIEEILNKGKIGEVYNIGSGNEMSNLEVITSICKIMSPRKDLIRYIKDRPGHDLRYSLNTDKISRLVKNMTLTSFEIGLKETIEFYMKNVD